MPRPRVLIATITATRIGRHPGRDQRPLILAQMTSEEVQTADVRHPDTSQRAMIAGRLANMTRADAGRIGGTAGGEANPNSDLLHQTSIAEAAALLNVGRNAVAEAKRVIRDAPASCG